MVYTVTFNPSLDYIVDVANFVLGHTNRTTREQMLPGGKGINVSLVLGNLGISSVALGFLAGFTGHEIARVLGENGIRSDFIQCEGGLSRINVKLRTIDGTEINGIGPEIGVAQVDMLYDKLEKLQDGDTLVLAGSIPSSLPETMYSDIMERLSGKNLDIVVDATRDLLMNVLQYRPFLIKPNKDELEEIFDVKIETQDDILACAKKLQDKGARNVLVSMGGKGAMLLAENGETYHSLPPQGKLINSVGAGDSMVAGFVAGYQQSGSYEHAFYMGLCTGSASAFSENLATRAEVEALLTQLGKKIN